MDVMIVKKIHLVLIQQQTTVTIKIRKIPVFVFLIMLLAQDYDLHLHLGIRFQKTELNIKHLIVSFYFSGKHSLFSVFINRKFL